MKEASSGKVIFDFLQPGQKFLAARGGRGGRGNASFATPVHRAPREVEEGKPGEEKSLILELKLIADVGLVGFPNAGKSTLLSRISAARPEIADYPFTTLVPHLGVVDIDEERSMVVADIPGLIEGAHEGHGLGIQFLRHIERTRVLVHLVDVSPYTGRSPDSDFQVVQKELEAFHPALVQKPQVVAANKVDLLGTDRSRLEALRDFVEKQGYPFYAVSALKGIGLKKLVEGMARALEGGDRKTT